MHRRKSSFISFPDSENEHDAAPYTYKNETAIPETNGYLIPTKNDNEYIAPPNDYTSMTSEVGYTVPPEEPEAQEVSIYNDDAFEGDENPYEMVRDVHYRSESYAEE